MESSFFSPGSLTSENQLAILHLSRDHSLPVILSSSVLNAQEEGYAEGVVTNTKFGSFPHTTLLDIPWGSQVKASKVDTGSRGRPAANKKRKADAISQDSPALREATQATSGFIHVLPPTPENWTTSLPHRTQVVYTPDYSYILQKIRARPGSVLLEAGSGSGSFTHAAARAVYNGDVQQSSNADINMADFGKSRSGMVYTFEFHPERHEKIHIEMEQHQLAQVVRTTHRDVYKDGFLLLNQAGELVSPNANAIFLDLPAPWQALPHLSRTPANGQLPVLDPCTAAHVCTFSPCIEQVQKTISCMRQLGWLEIETVEIQHSRIDVRREFTGLQYDGMRSVNAVPVDIDEALGKLRDLEARAMKAERPSDGSSKRTRIDNSQFRQQDASKLLYKEGRIIHRTEPEIKTHTSYLVFAVLPREWSEQDEEVAQLSIQDGVGTVPKSAKSQRQLKKEAKLRKKHVQDKPVNETNNTLPQL